MYITVCYVGLLSVWSVCHYFYFVSAFEIFRGDSERVGVAAWNFPGLYKGKSARVFDMRLMSLHGSRDSKAFRIIPASTLILFLCVSFFSKSVLAIHPNKYGRRKARTKSITDRDRKLISPRVPSILCWTRHVTAWAIISPNPERRHPASSPIFLGSSTHRP